MPEFNVARIPLVGRLLQKKAPDRLKPLHTMESGRSEGIVVEGVSLSSKAHPRINQDSMFVLPTGRAFGVFDGLGGHACGDVASQTAAQVIRAGMGQVPGKISLDEVQQRLVSVLDQANSTILDSQRINSSYKGMGTTATVAYIWEGKIGEARKLIVAHLGDSRAYLIRGTQLEHLTIDDGEIASRYAGNTSKILEIQRHMSSVTSLRALTEEELQLRDYRQRLYKYLGIPGITPAISVWDFQPGDIALCVTDGITDSCPDPFLLRQVSLGSSTQVKADNVLWTSNRMSVDPQNQMRKSYSDDATVVVAQSTQ